MKIIVLGNIGSGKTSLAQKIQEKHPAYTIVAIDEFRCQYADGTMQGELKAQELFLETIANSTQPQIIEATGFGQLGADLQDLFAEDNHEILCIILKVSPEIIHKRIETRQWKTPFPLGTEGIPELIQRIDYYISSGFIEFRWKALPTTRILIAPNTNLKEQSQILKCVDVFLEL